MPTPRPLAQGLVFPESPRWHEGRLWLSDMYDGRVCTIEADGSVNTVARFDDRPSGLGFLPDGTPLVALMDERALYRLTVTGPVLHADLRGFASQMVNDMVVGSTGRAYVDCIGSHDDHGSPRSGTDSIVRVELDGTVAVATTEVVRPNGLLLTADETSVITTDASHLTQFRVGEDGSLVEPLRFADIAGDGICLDASGCVWVGTLPGTEFVRVSPGGEVLDRISVDEWASACLLGGEDRRTLYLCTSRTTMDIMMNQAGHGAQGFVHTVDVPVAGAGVP